eukprot:TRINITY_DN1634_c0_g1_i1.p1 TRINITY_DN1634_c0_g1~~TRINITY_DN1634_c0_g1_i1.p1  ORF type:complete len:174 (+),score=40.51 TRINITY_DN1634_c0_g1_i1:300-821(+)
MSSSIIRYQYQGSIHFQKELNFQPNCKYSTAEIENQILRTNFLGSDENENKVSLEFIEKSTGKVYERNEIIPSGANLIVRTISSWNAGAKFNEDDETKNLSSEINKNGGLEKDDIALEQTSKISHTIKHSCDFSGNNSTNVQQYIRLLNIRAQNKNNPRIATKNPQTKREPSL